MSNNSKITTYNERFNLSIVRGKMSNTLTALSVAFYHIIDLQDPMDQTHHEICKAAEKLSKKRELMDL